jgi:YrbI family 3-deoxy-D-manno-octulosonate 8-phosphate phosphatase
VRTISVIPARAGSKRIPQKNLLPLIGRPLIAHSVAHAVAAKGVDEVYVTTDDDAIADAARTAGAQIIVRPAKIASDTSSSESALLHALDELRGRGLDDPDLVVFLQPTSPVRSSRDIDAALEVFHAAEADSLFSAVSDRGLMWTNGGQGPRPLNYDPARRPREQEMGDQQRENGSIYVFKPSVLRETGSRLGGRIAIYPMDYWSSFQIDRPEDIELVEWILRRAAATDADIWPTQIDLVVFDFDGVMTDNTVVIDAAGGESVNVHRGDGWGIARLRERAVPMLILSTEEHPVVAARAAKLQLEVEHGVGDKSARLQALLDERGVDPAHVIYLGNDANDVGCLELVGLPVVVADATPEALRVARLVLRRKGGDGAVRELCDLVLARLGK